MNGWAAQELELLRTCWPQLECREDGWCRIPGFPVPAGWTTQTAEVAFRIPEDLPGQAPYAFLVRDGLRLATGQTVSDYAPEAATPWGGVWGQFSWQLDPWAPGVQPGHGTSMVDFVRSFTSRLNELS